MKNLREYINKLSNEFSFEDLKKYIEGEGTQKAAEFTEGYVESVTKEFFEDLLIIKAGSQQYPDFLMIKKENFDKANVDFKNDFYKKMESGKPIFKTVLNYSEIDKNFNDSLIRVEVKSAKSSMYQCNDSLPSPINHVLYICFDQKQQKVFINTSVQMAKAQGEEKYNFLVEKYKLETQQIAELRTSKKEEWKNFGIGSTPRMTYTINTKYAHVEQTEKTFDLIIEILRKAGWEK